MTVEGALLALEATSRGRIVDARGEILERIASKTDPQNIRTLQVGEASDVGGVEFECIGVCCDLVQFRLEEANLRHRNRRSEEFQRQMEIGGRDPFDAVIVSAHLRDDIVDRALDLGADADCDKGANLFGQLSQW